MPDLGPHAAFIVAAYAVTFIALAALAFCIVDDDRKQRGLLAALEARGIKRRSAQAPAKSNSAGRHAKKKREE
jgi:heme exporter protein D